MRNKFVRVLLCIAFNTLLGFTFGSFLGAPAVGAIAGFTLPAMLGRITPAGSLAAGVYAEIWTGEIVKALNEKGKATFLDGIPDMSQYADKNVIHLNDVGADPAVLVNNSTYPLVPQQLPDGDVAISLDKFETQPTSITDDELHAISYDKITNVKERHATALASERFQKSIHALAPNSNLAKTPVIETTGTLDGTRMRMTMADLATLKNKLDKMEVPLTGRRLVLCPEHIMDILNLSQAFANQYYSYAEGKVMQMFGFDIYEYVANPYFSTALAKVAYGTAPGSTDRQASVAFWVNNTFKATGETKMYYQDAATDPLYKRNIISFTNWYIALPKRAEACAAIVSGVKA
jgi:hypothetical protein